MLKHTLRTGYFAPKNATYKGQLADYQLKTTWVLNRGLNDKELEDLTLDITKYCAQFGLEASFSDPYHLKVKGDAKCFSAALLTQISAYQDGDNTYHTSGEIKLPSEWANKVIHIFGLDNSPIAKPYYHLLKLDTPFDASIDETTKPRKRNAKLNQPKAAPRAVGYFTPLQLATLYNFPSGNGVGQKIGIIELGGGFVQSDINTYFSNLGIASPPTINAIGVNGAINNPDTSGASIEVILDIEVIVALVPRATINVYFAPNSDQGFYNAINKARIDSCSIISISWGAAEPYWSGSSLSAYNSLFQAAANSRISVFAAAGDNGSSDGAPGVNTDFPSSSPYVVACGGTTLIANGNSITSETVWNNSTSSATGGGLSAVFSKPAYQSGISFNLNGRRGVPDVSGVANPTTGYLLYCQRLGGALIVGGTSAVSPLWSALTARINQSLNANNKQNVGFIHSTIYNNIGAFRDVTIGNNGAYQASHGWDPCTGNGSPNGAALLTIFSNAGVPTSPPVAAFNASPASGSTPLTVSFTNTSTGATSYLWNFGDGATSASTSPSHQYLNSISGTTATFTATLTATNAGGSNSVSRTISVANLPNVAPPVAAFTAMPTVGTSPLSITFTNLSTNATSYLWNFGNGTTSTAASPTHIYTTFGLYTVTLTATNASGSNIATRANYIAVTTPIAAKPKAIFTATPAAGKRPLSVKFTDQSTGAPSSWTWLFGDGNISNARNPTHIYRNAGRYTVSLAVSNAKGSSSVTKTNIIRIT